MCDLNREKYIQAMTANLQMLRAKLGLTQQEICKLVGVSRQSIVQAEKNSKLAWNTYLALVFLFSKNKKHQMHKEKADNENFCLQRINLSFVTAVAKCNL